MSSNEYLRFAQECARAATLSENRKNQEDLLHIAKLWTQLGVRENGDLQLSHKGNPNSERSVSSNKSVRGKQS
jgi:hypothetical protein